MLTINPVVNSSNYNFLNFSGFLPRKTFRDIRDIPRLKCGCCDNVMLTSEETTVFIKSFKAGSKRALENSAMDELRDTEAFQFVKSLSEIQPKETIRRLILAKENRFKIGTFDARIQLDVERIAKISDGITVKAPRVMQKFEKYRGFFGEEDSEILKLMDMYALKYPKKTFAEIFNMPEVAQYHRELYELNKKEAATQRIEVFKRLRGLGQHYNLTPQELRKLQSVNSKAMNVLTCEYYQPDIKKGLIDDLYNGLADDLKGKIRRKKLMSVVTISRLKDIPLTLL